MPSIIYQPRELINVRENIGGGFLAAALQAAQDFISGNNRPWTFYLGVALGQMAVATGIPGAAATMYVVGDTVDGILFHSPDGSDVRIFLNGVLHSSLDTYAVGAIWETFNVNGLVGGQVNRIDIVNYGPSSDPEATGVPWLAIGPITLTGTSPRAIGAYATMPNALSVRIADAESDTQQATLPIYLPSTGLTVAQIQTYADALLAEVDALTGGTIESCEVTFSLTLPGGLKSEPTAGILNERGGLITFDTSGPRRDSVRIPAMNRTIMPGDSFSLADTAVAAFITRLTTESTAANIRPQTANGFNWVTARSGKKSFRK